jgi:putative hydrolase of the HAD superfamily
LPALDAVFFDIDDTLFPTTAFARRARRNAVRAMCEAGIDASEEVVLKELEEVIAEFSSNYEHHFDKLLTRLGPRVTADRNSALIVAAGVAAYHDTKFRTIAPFDDVLPLLDELQSAGLIVGIITHGLAVKQAEKLWRLGVMRHVDPRAVFISDQVGINKPNPKLYQHALRALKLEPARTMYVGDNPEHDIAPPLSLGMPAVWASRAARRKPVDYGIEPTHQIANFGELRQLLRERYDVPV